jgi:transcriptional regulator with XRE-family HTH domain
MNNIGEYIRDLRMKRGLPLRKLAAALDIDTSTLAKMEKGTRSFQLNMAPILANELGLDFKSFQIDLLASIIIQEHGKEKYAPEALKKALKRIEKELVR